MPRLYHAGYFLASNLEIAIHPRAYISCDRIASDYLWFSVLIPYVRWSVLPWREEWRKIISLYGFRTFRTCPPHRRGTILYGVRPVLSSFIYRCECDTIPRVSDTMGMSARYVESPNDSDPPVSFPLSS